MELTKSLIHDEARKKIHAQKIAKRIHFRRPVKVIVRKRPISVRNQEIGSGGDSVIYDRLGWVFQDQGPKQAYV